MPAERHSIVRRPGLLDGLAAALLAAGLALGAGPAAAQQAPSGCEKLGGLLQKQGRLVGIVQGFQKKQTSAANACNVFSQLQSNTSSVIAELETNGTWCHAPPEMSENFKQQQGQITAARGKACSVAAQQKKMEAQARKQQQNRNQVGGGPIGGGGDVLGGSIKVPQGAL